MPAQSVEVGFGLFAFGGLLGCVGADRGFPAALERIEDGLTAIDFRFPFAIRNFSFQRKSTP